jgi:hypothetical protein
MPTPSVVHWYKIPKTIRDKAKQNGLPTCPSEIGLRPQTGADVERALAADLKKKSLDFATKKVMETLAGVNYDENCDPAKRQVVSRASNDPNLFPDYLFSILPAQVVTLLQRAFSDINDPDEEDQDAFLKSHSVSA